MKILVTGGAGFIGSAYIKKLLNEQLASQVIVYDKLTYAGNLQNLRSVEGDARLRFVQADIDDAVALDAQLPGLDAVVNFAAESHVDRSIAGPRDFFLSNTLGAQTLFQACLRNNIKRVVHIGTDEVYGSIREGSWTEESPLLPNSPYAASKAAAELIARAYFTTFGLNISTTRCSNNYGPFQYPEKVIPLFITNLIDGKRVPLYGTGSNRRDWLHVSDHLNGIQLVLEKGAAGESYNIGGGTELSNLDLTKLILKAFDCDDSMIENVADRMGHDFRYSVDDSKLRKLGYEPKTSFADGLQATIEWYKQNEEWWRPLK